MGKKLSKRRRAEQVLHSLWGCPDITSKEIKSFVEMKVKQIIQNEKSNNLFKSYLKSNQTTDESNDTLKYLEFYEFCYQILSDLESLQDNVSQLLEICPEETWKQKIEDARAVDANTENNRQLEDVLEGLKDECLNNIEHERDFNEFLNELRSKVKK